MSLVIESPINVICVKTHSKYPSEYVNNLLRMVEHTLSRSFNFHCYTDDPIGLDEKVRVLPYVEFDLPGVYNKLALFREDIGLEGECLYFDLDVIIQKPINDIAAYAAKGGLTVISTHWKPSWWRKFSNQLHMINSSCMAWQTGFVEHIWERLMSNREYFLARYYSGMDTFLAYEALAPNRFARELFYSVSYEGRILDLPVGILNGFTHTKDQFYRAIYEEFYGRCISSTISSQSPS